MEFSSESKVVGIQSGGLPIIEEPFDINRLKANKNYLPNNSELAQILPNSKFFILKSCNMDNIQVAKNYSQWATTTYNQKKLNDAFQIGKPVFLIFAVNQINSFQGVALMESVAGFQMDRTIWKNCQGIRLGGNFSIRWLRLSSLDYSQISSEMNSITGEPVTKSRDCQEIDMEVGYRICMLFDEPSNQIQSPYYPEVNSIRSYDNNSSNSMTAASSNSHSMNQHQAYKNTNNIPRQPILYSSNLGYANNIHPINHNAYGMYPSHDNSMAYPVGFSTENLNLQQEVPKPQTNNGISAVAPAESQQQIEEKQVIDDFDDIFSDDENDEKIEGGSALASASQNIPLIDKTPLIKQNTSITSVDLQNLNEHQLDEKSSSSEQRVISRTENELNNNNNTNNNASSSTNNNAKKENAQTGNELNDKKELNENQFININSSSNSVKPSISTNSPFNPIGASINAPSYDSTDFTQKFLPKMHPNTMPGQPSYFYPSMHYGYGMPQMPYGMNYPIYQHPNPVLTNLTYYNNLTVNNQSIAGQSSQTYNDFKQKQDQKQQQKHRNEDSSKSRSRSRSDSRDQQKSKKGDKQQQN